MILAILPFLTEYLKKLTLIPSWQAALLGSYKSWPDSHSAILSVGPLRRMEISNTT
jgi:hypothetical protein